MYLIYHVTSHGHLIERAYKFFGGNSLCYVTTLISLVAITIVMVEIQCFYFVACLFVNTCLKGYVNLWVEARHGESPSCHVWWPLVLCKWRYKIFNTSRDLTKQREIFMVYHHFAKFGGHSYCSSKDMFLVCHVIKQDLIIKGSCDYNDRIPSRLVTILPSLVVIGTLVGDI